jgi:non-lysosomal glucosylceramidase
MTDTPTSTTYDHTAHVLAFPLGGIGTGNVSLGARGDLRDWEIFNQPAKGNHLPNTFFTLRVQVPDKSPVMRVLEGPIQPPFSQSHGFHPASHAGLPRFSGTTFKGEYPFAWIQFHDLALPVSVRMEAFTPLIPLNPRDSGIPCAILTYTITNISEESVEITLVGSLINPVGGIQFDPYGNIQPNSKGLSNNQVRHGDGFHGLHYTANGLSPRDLTYGDLTLATDHPDITAKPVWLRGRWYDFLREFWDDLQLNGKLTDLGYTNPPRDGRPDTGSLGIRDTLVPGEENSYRFILTWYFPNRIRSWESISNLEPDEIHKRLTRNHYATVFKDAWNVARYTFEELPRLESDTRRFHDALFTSTFPRPVLEAISANIVPLRSTTCFWLEDGRFFGWEGCFDNAGCCAGSCTHVWSYAYTLAYLFPSLERAMRKIEFLDETDQDGFMNFRNFQALGDIFVWAGGNKPEPAVDGQMGSILRAYREWLLSGDKTWLTAIWPGIKSAITFAGAHWDTDKDGVLDGVQHNTYDIEFHGPNPLCGIYYLAALRAVEEMAKVMAETGFARRTRERFETSRQLLDILLWNGEYYIQKIDDVDAHPYQHGTGCLSDQLLGQLHARILNLGDLLPPDHIRTAVKSIYTHNFLENFRHHTNFQRTYALNDESGLVLCTWPHGGKPHFPFVYSDEVWTGIEYAAAALLFYEGWLEEGLRVVQAVRDRHDGHRRNPWDEVECGHHYARSMSSWALLLALSGYHCDINRGEMWFDPLLTASSDPVSFKTFWSNGLAWGTYTQKLDPETGTWQHTLDVLGGDLSGCRVIVNGREIHPSAIIQRSKTS